MINHCERFLQRCSKRYKDQMTTDGISESETPRFKNQARKNHDDGDSTNSAGEWLFARMNCIRLTQMG